MEDLKRKNPACGGNTSGAKTESGHTINEEQSMNNIPDLLNQEYRQKSVASFRFKDVYDYLNPNNDFAFSVEKHHYTTAKSIGMLTSGSEVANFKTGMFWCGNGFSKKSFDSQGLTNFRRKIGIGAKSIDLIHSMTVEVDSIDLYNQAIFWKSFCEATGLEILCITSSGEDDPELLRAFRDAFIKNNESLAKFNDLLNSGKVRKGKSYHVTFGLVPIFNSTNEQKSQYVRIAKTFALLCAGDLVACNLDRLMRAPGTWCVGADGVLCVQPIYFFNGNAKKYTLDEIENHLEAFIKNKYGDFDIEWAKKCLQMHNDLQNPKRYNVRLMDPKGILASILDEIIKNKVIDFKTYSILKEIRRVSQSTESLTIVNDLKDFDKIKSNKVNFGKVAAKTNKGDNVVSWGGKSYLPTSTEVYVIGRGAVPASKLIEEGKDCRCNCPVHAWSNTQSNNASFSAQHKTVYCYKCSESFIFNDEKSLGLGLENKDNDILNTIYDYNNIKRYPLDPPTRKMTVFSGPCGAGKSYCVSSLMQKAIKENEDNYFIQLNYRRSLVGQSVQSYHLRSVKITDYRDKNGATNYDNLGICIDSFWKERKNNIEIDIDGCVIWKKRNGKRFIIIDEVTQVLSSLLDVNSKIKGFSAEHMIEKLKSYAKDPNTYFIVMDADFDECSLWILKKMLGLENKDIETRNFINFTEEYSYNILASRDDFEARAIEYISQGKKVFLGTASIKHTYDLETIIKSRFPTKKVVNFNSETLEILEKQGKKLDTLDQDGQWTEHDCDVLIGSPTMQAGVSIVAPFDKVLLCMDAPHVRATDIIQMARRCRNLLDKTIDAYIPEGGAFKTYNMKKYIENDNAIRDFQNGIITKLPKAINKDLYEEILESYNNLPLNEDMRALWVANLCRNRYLGGDGCRLRDAFLALCAEREIEVSMQDPADSVLSTNKEEVKATRAEKKEAREARAEIEKDEVLNAEDISFEEAQKLLNKDLSKDKRQSVQKAMIKHFFDKDVTSDLYDRYTDKDELPKLKNMALLNCTFQHKLSKVAARDVQTAHYGAGRDKKNNLVRLQLFLNLLKKLGILKDVKTFFKNGMIYLNNKIEGEQPTIQETIFINSLDNKITLDKSKVKIAHDWLKSESNKIFKDLGFYVAPSKDSTKERSPIPKINDLLRSFGLEVEAKRVRVPVFSDQCIYKENENTGTNLEWTYYLDQHKMFDNLMLSIAEYNRLSEDVTSLGIKKPLTEEEKKAIFEKEGEIFKEWLKSSGLDEEEIMEYDIDADNDDIRFSIYEMINSDGYYEDDEE